MQAAFSNSTIRKYNNAWSAMARFLTSVGGSHRLPVATHMLALHLVDEFLEGRKPGTIKGDLAAIAWFHKLAGLEDPSKHYLLKKVLTGLTKLGPPKKQKKPLTWALLGRVVGSLSEAHADYEVRLYRAVFILAYFASLRASEYTHSSTSNHTLRLKDVAFSHADEGTKLILTLSSFKNSKRPARLVVSPSGVHNLCPVKAVKDFLKVRKSGVEQLFTKRDGSRLSRHLVAKTLKGCVRSCGLNPEDFDTHSFRAGRTTDLVEWGASDAVIRESGRWGSNAFLEYVRFDLFHLPKGSMQSQGLLPQCD